MFSFPLQVASRHYLAGEYTHKHIPNITMCYIIELEAITHGLAISVMSNLGSRPLPIPSSTAYKK
jgi:hypothetical protein